MCLCMISIITHSRGYNYAYYTKVKTFYTNINSFFYNSLNADLLTHFIDVSQHSL